MAANPKWWQSERTVVLVTLMLLWLLGLGTAWLFGLQSYILAIVILLLIFSVVIFVGYTSRRVIFLGVRGRTLWDWLQLLIIPAVLVAAAGWFNTVQTQTSLLASERQHQTDLQIATDQQQEATLQTYLDRMSELLFNNRLRESKPGDEVRNVARARTLTALHALDKRRNNLLIQFLREAQLLQKGHPIVDLSNADLSGDQLSGDQLSGIDLSSVKLGGADLRGTNLSGTYLWRADLRKADLRGTNLSQAYLWRADLSGTYLGETDLKEADLSRAILCGAQLGKTSLTGVSLSGTIMPNDCTHPNPPDSSISVPLSQDLGADDSQWGLFYDGGKATGSVTNATDPNINGLALQVSLRDGDPYTGVQAYRNFPPNHLAKEFHLSLSFYLTDVAPIQALEFTMSQWVANQRWEWALQWEHVGDNTTHRGNPPTWRLWDGPHGLWLDTAVPQDLIAGKWYKFDLRGTVMNGQVQYISFSCGSVSADLTKQPTYTFAPVSNPGDKLAIGVQIDGNDHEEGYDVYIDEIQFS